MSERIPPELTIPDPNNPDWTIPRTWGVWDIGPKRGARRFRYGNYPVRGNELAQDYGSARLVVLFTDRTTARNEAVSLNRE